MDKLNNKIVYLVNLILEEEGLENKNGVILFPYTRIELPKDIIYKIINKLEYEECLQKVDYMHYILKEQEEGLDIDINDVYSDFVNDNLLIKPNFEELKKFKKKNFDELKVTGIPQFNEDESLIIWGNLKCKIPKNSNQYFLCKVMFNAQPFIMVKEIEILDSIDLIKKEGSKRTVYDAMLIVNKKMEIAFSIKDFFEYKNNHLMINSKYKNLLNKVTH